MDENSPAKVINTSDRRSISSSIYMHIKNKGGECKVYPAPFDVRLTADDKTVVQPAISVICDTDKLTEEGCTGAPDWIIEIVSLSNPENDYIRKLNKYLSSGVREYWIVDPARVKIFVYGFGAGETYPKEYSFNSRIKAGIYEDLHIDFADIML